MSFDSWYYEIPTITRWYLTLSVLTTALCFFDIISPFSLYLNFRLIVEKYEVWRIFTNFFFFGMPSLDFVFHMYFLVRYCRLLEEGPSFRGKSADFLTMVLFGASLMLCIAPFSSVFFLGSSLTFMMVYVWGRRNETFPMNFLGLFNFPAPWLPWVLLGFSVLLGASPVVDLIGIFVGHVYYYLEDIVPRMPGRFRGRRVIFTPAILKYLLEGPQLLGERDRVVFQQPPGDDDEDGMDEGDGGFEAHQHQD
mmetsp:Transcript_13927/g.34016  ORF Transcript_13927/g.34016 Transcript_13927/m.34016 type:complete len:251 (+) Transcript_13927:299-1051(+)